MSHQAENKVTSNTLTGSFGRLLLPQGPSACHSQRNHNMTANIIEYLE